jgi:hypothetical protein
MAGCLERGENILEELPAEGEKRLLALWRQIPETRQGRSDQPYSTLDQLR